MALTGHPNIVITHVGPWRGKPQHLWTTIYNLSGPTPSAGDQAQLMTQLVAIESAILSGGTGRGFVNAKFYSGQKPNIPTAVDPLGTPAAPLPYNSADWAAGGNAPTGNCEPEQCLLVETLLNGLSSRGKPVYLRKYFHAISDTAATTGRIPGAVAAAINTRVAAWTNGTLANGVVVISPSGRQSTSPPAAKTYVWNRQMPRGRRKKKKAITVAAGNQVLEVTPGGSLASNPNGLDQPIRIGPLELG